ncbi:unnamed protein product [Knipowitschia caucasica]
MTVPPPQGTDPRRPKKKKKNKQGGRRGTEGPEPGRGAGAGTWSRGRDVEPGPGRGAGAGTWSRGRDVEPGPGRGAGAGTWNRGRDVKPGPGRETGELEPRRVGAGAGAGTGAKQVRKPEGPLDGETMSSGARSDGSLQPPRTEQSVLQWSRTKTREGCFQLLQRLSSWG